MKANTYITNFTIATRIGFATAFIITPRGII